MVTETAGQEFLVTTIIYFEHDCNIIYLGRRPIS